MIVYICIIALIVLFWNNAYHTGSIEQKQRAEKRAMLIVGAILVVLAALRGGIGDTGGYVRDYEYLSNSSFSQILKDHEGIGAGYFWLMKLFSLSGLSVRWWFAVVEFFYLFCVYSFVNKFAKDKLFCLLCFFCMGLYMFSLAGLKQTMAMGFSLLAFNEFYDKRYVRFAIFFLLAYWCHTATLAFGFGFVIYYFRNIRYFYPLAILMTAIVILFGSEIWTALITGLEDEHYIMYAEADNTYSAWTFVFYLLLLGIIFFNRKAYTRDNKAESNYLFGIFFLAVAFQSLSTSFSTAFRIAYYYLPFTLILMSNICEPVKGETDNRRLKMILAGVIIFWQLYTSRDFTFPFFWNGYGIE